MCQNFRGKLELHFTVFVHITNALPQGNKTDSVHFMKSGVFISPRQSDTQLINLSDNCKATKTNNIMLKKPCIA